MVEFKTQFFWLWRLWITVNQTNRAAGSVFRGSVWSPANFKEELPTPRKALTNAGWLKNVGWRSVRWKTPVSKKRPLKTVALAVDAKAKAIESSRVRAQSWWRPSQASWWRHSRAWEARVECRWHGKETWKWNEEQQQQNEDQKWNEDTKMKAAHTLNNLDRGAEPENEDHESEGP